MLHYTVGSPINPYRGSLVLHCLLEAVVRGLDKLQNSPFFYVCKFARAVKQNVWSEAENGEQDSRLTRATAS